MLGRRRSAALACALTAAAAFVSGCSAGREGGAGREGRPEDLGGLTYNVFLTRQLNIKDPEDHGYYQGPEAPPGYVLEGVFISVCNESRGGPSFPATDSFTIVDTQGHKFTPLALPPTNVFAYRPGVVAHRQCIPVAGSPAALGTIGGALLLFQLPLPATENRPLDLVIEAPPGTVGRQQVKVELDI